MCTMTASIITAIAGGLWQGYTQSQQAKAAASQAEANARVADMNAKKLEDQAAQADENSRINRENEQRKLAARMAHQRVNIAGSGLSATGSALTALADSSYEMEKDLAMQGYNDRQKTDNMRSSATDQVNVAENYKQQASDYRKAGKWAWINAGMTTAFSLASGLYGAKSAAVQNAGGSAVRAGTYSANGAWDLSKTWSGLSAPSYKVTGKGIGWEG